ncbi:MAG: polysaccharide export protein [Caulobacteraceae bacterium]|nr:polysaccharide export protein [Caulobacter sp.]
MAPPSRRFVLVAGGSLALCACQHDASPPPTPFAEIRYSTWREDEPGYRFYPGDQIDVAVPSAPELNRTLTVQPDGRIAMPLVGEAMAADRTLPQLQQSLAQAYARQLIDPRVEVSVRQATPIRVFVGGEVGRPGVYDMPGDIDALQGVIMAGGVLNTANPRKTVIIRRGPDGAPMRRYVDLGQAVRHGPSLDTVPLRRFDVIYVPKSGIANVDLWVQQYLTNVIPVQFSYATGGAGYLTTR